MVSHVKLVKVRLKIRDYFDFDRPCSGSIISWAIFIADISPWDSPPLSHSSHLLCHQVKPLTDRLSPGWKEEDGGCEVIISLITESSTAELQSSQSPVPALTAGTFIPF